MVTYHIFASMDTEIAYVASFEDAFHDSKVQRGLEKCSVWSLWDCHLKRSLITTIAKSINSRTISYKDKLPWHKWIPSNPPVVLRVLDGVA